MCRLSSLYPLPREARPLGLTGPHTHTPLLPPSLHPAAPHILLNRSLTSKDADKEKVEKAARPMPPRTTRVLAFQFLGLANHPPEGVQMCVGK